VNLKINTRHTPQPQRVSRAADSDSIDPACLSGFLSTTRAHMWVSSKETVRRWWPSRDPAPSKSLQVDTTDRLPQTNPNEEGRREERHEQHSEPRRTSEVLVPVDSLQPETEASTRNRPGGCPTHQSRLGIEPSPLPQHKHTGRKVKGRERLGGKKVAWPSSARFSVFRCL
jgi:hypothetical protein